MITTERRGRFSTLRYTHACGHPGELRCQSIHDAAYRRLAQESALGLCRKCRGDLLARVTKAEAEVKQLRAEMAERVAAERSRIAGMLAEVGEALEGDSGPVISALAVLVKRFVESL